MLKTAGYKKVLIYEDEAINRLHLMDILESSDYQVDTAGDGELALEKLQNEHYHLIFLDLMMPRVTGFEVLDRISSDPARYADNTGQIIVVTAYDHLNIAKLKDEGVIADYVIKPFRPGVIFKKVGQYLNCPGGFSVYLNP